LENLRIFFLFLKNIVQNSYMVKTMVVRDLHSRYSGSLLGIFWSVIHPLAQVVTFTFIYTYAFDARLPANEGTTVFAVWFMCGLLPWLMFADTVKRSSNILIANKNLITKNVFPSEILPAVVLFSNIVNHFIFFGIVMFLILITGGKVSIFILLLPFYLLVLSVFALGVGWIVASVDVFLRDVNQILTVVIQLWFFFTPIMYPASILPPEIQTILKINPLYHVIDGYRRALLTHEWPDVSEVGYLVVVSLVIIGLGGIVFRRLKPDFADVL